MIDVGPRVSYFSTFLSFSTKSPFCGLVIFLLQQRHKQGNLKRECLTDLCVQQSVSFPVLWETWEPGAPGETSWASRGNFDLFLSDVKLLWRPGTGLVVVVYMYESRVTLGGAPLTIEEVWPSGSWQILCLFYPDFWNLYIIWSELWENLNVKPGRLIMSRMLWNIWDAAEHHSSEPGNSYDHVIRDLNNDGSHGLDSALGHGDKCKQSFSTHVKNLLY